MFRTKDEVLSEVYCYLNVLGDWFINRLPKDEYEKIKKNRNINYNPVYQVEDFKDDNKMTEKARRAIAYYHLHYWCVNEEDKKVLLKVFKNNNESLERKYEPFKNRAKVQNEDSNQPNSQDMQLTIPVKTGFFKKIQLFFQRLKNKF